MRSLSATVVILTAVFVNGPVPSAGAMDDATLSFDVASVKPSQARVQFEHDGKTEISPVGVNMRDVTPATCIKWAYNVQDSQISGPGWIQSERYDIVAKTGRPVPVEQLKLMMRTLLGERFRLSFHREDKELRYYLMTVAKGGHKLHESDADAKPFRQNSAVGTSARAITMGEFADFVAGPLNTPVVDMTGLKSRYDFTLDFTSYLPVNEKAMKVDYDDSHAIILAALQGELGLKMVPQKGPMTVLIIDHAEKPMPN